MNIESTLPDNGRQLSPSAAPTHRRVELQSVADLLYLQNNVAHAARAKIDLHLPPEASQREGDTGVDAMRRAVEKGVNKYIEDTFATAKMGISVNGIDAEKIEWEKEVPEEFESFDTKLASRISALHTQIETLNLDLANKRRTAAQLAAKNFREGFSAQSEALDKTMEQRVAEAEQDKTSLESIARLQVPAGYIDRQEDIRRTWESTTASLGSLQAEVVQTSARGEKAKEVLDYLEGL